MQIPNISKKNYEVDGSKIHVVCSYVDVIINHTSSVCCSYVDVIRLIVVLLSV